MDSYLRTKSILMELGINSLEDYQSCVKEWTNNPLTFRKKKFSRTTYFVSRTGQIKIDSLRQIVVDDFMDFKEKPLIGQYISIDTHQHQNIQLDNYMCIFPKHTLIETETLVSYDSGKFSVGYDAAPDDYFLQFFKYEKLIKGNVVQLYPIRTGISTGAHETFDEVMEYSPVAPLDSKKIAHVSHGRDFSRIAHQANYFYLAFPWLYNANTDTYLDICSSYPAEFENLAITIEKISCACNLGEDFNTNVLKDLREALVNIQIAFERKQAILKAKGKTAVVGLILTYIPFVIPSFFNNFDPKLFSGIIGATSIISNRNLLNEFVELKNIGIDNPFWVIWKWRSKS